jgi:hypothetical protein
VASGALNSSSEIRRGALASVEALLGGIDALDRDLFGTRVIETKARRVVHAACPDCGRRGYHLKFCTRASLTDEVRIAYVFKLVFQRGPTSSSSRRAPAKLIANRSARKGRGAMRAR